LFNNKLFKGNVKVRPGAPLAVSFSVRVAFWTVSEEVFAKEAPGFSCRTPWLMLTAPVSVEAAPSTKAPGPVFVKPVVPAMTELIVAVTPEAVAILGVVPSRNSEVPPVIV